MPHSDLMQDLLDILRTNIETTIDPAWRIFRENERPNLKRCDAALDTALSVTPEAEKAYFNPCRRRYRALLSLIEPFIQPGWRVLDMGCSPGHIAIALDKLGCHVNGIDLNHHYLPKYPSQEWIERLSIQSVEIEQRDLPFESGMFDAIVFTEVLEHIAIRHPHELMTEFRRVLKPGGRLLLSTPNFANVSQLLAFSRQQNVMWKPEIFYGGTDRHNREYVPHELRTLIDAAFDSTDYYLMNADHNWNPNTYPEARELSLKAEQTPCPPHIFFNTMLALARAPQ